MSSETRTFRLDNEIIKYLEQEAKKQGATLNGLVCRILRNYVRIESKIKQIGIISLFRDDFINILNLIDENKISELGIKIGNSIPKDIILLLFGEISMNSLRQFLSLVLHGYLNWINVNEIENEDYIEIRAWHNMGNKWSIFIKNFIESLFISTINIKPRFKYISDSSIIFTINKN
ncbi:MAG: hypothetical protein NO475_05715 [Candidatus Methanomethylicia archaeon]|nr:hypothetical protein [Candidatus Methanomethylicia archaeon]MCQ5340640.1 hypothetical protein [Candidatus Methanomethylicia archaeon]